MIRKSKGKYRWSRKATYSVDWSLSPIIHSYLVQLKSQLENANSCGVPIHYCNLQAKVEGYEKYDWDVDIDLDAAHQLRMKDLDELIWAFDPKSEPQIKDYDFHYDNSLFSKDNTATFVCSNESERNRYYKDLMDYEVRKKAALKLFSEIYVFALDW